MQKQIYIKYIHDISRFFMKNTSFSYCIDIFYKHSIRKKSIKLMIKTCAKTIDILDDK